MHCPICGEYSEDAKRARHLPRFARCPNCGGYVTEEKTAIEYPTEYFVEETETPKKSVFSPLLVFFLWLRVRKIRKILNYHPSHPLLTTPFKAVSPWKGEMGGEAEEGSSSPPFKGGDARGGHLRILDYGCGNGKLVAYLRAQGLDAEGYDPSPSAVALAQRQGLPVFGAVPNKKYDLVMFWHSLEHSDTPLLDILALKNRVTQNGRLLIAVPNGDALEARLFGESFFCYDWPFHRVHFTPRALTTLLAKAEFRVLTIDHFNPEYTVSSLVQTFLNLFLPKNALYSFVSARRQSIGKGTLLSLALLSLLLVIAFSPLLVFFFITALLLKKTAAFIMVGTAEQTRNKNAERDGKLNYARIYTHPSPPTVPYRGRVLPLIRENKTGKRKVLYA